MTAGITRRRLRAVPDPSAPAGSDARDPELAAIAAWLGQLAPPAVAGELVALVRVGLQHPQADPQAAAVAELLAATIAQQTRRRVQGQPPTRLCLQEGCYG